MSTMRKGQIVRRRRDNKPIGPYMTVIAVNKDYLICKYLETELETLLQRKNAYEIKTKPISIDLKEFENLCTTISRKNTKNSIVIKHDLCKSWLDVCNKKYDLLCLYSKKPKQSKIYATYNNAYRAFHREITRSGFQIKYEVKISLNEIIAII